jgi:hypothetical protein
LGGNQGHQYQMPAQGLVVNCKGYNNFSDFAIAVLYDRRPLSIQDEDPASGIGPDIWEKYSLKTTQMFSRLAMEWEVLGMFNKS